jgi:hypothetical protein
VIIQSKYYCSALPCAWTNHPCSPPLPTAPRIIRIHIRTISTNAIHPLAQQSPLQISLPSISAQFSNHIHSVVLDFAGKTFALYFCTFDQVRPSIQIWDWTTSDVIVVRHILDYLQSIDRSCRVAFSLSIVRSLPGRMNLVLSIPPTALSVIHWAPVQFGCTSSCDLLQLLAHRSISRRSISRPQPVTLSESRRSPLIKPPSRRIRSRMSHLC